MIHGGRDHCRNWDWVAQALRDDFHIIAPDLRGHGDSAWAVGGSYMLRDFVYDIAQLVRQRTMAPLSIIAHSMGGFISSLYTGVFPETVSRLVIVDGIVHSPPEIKAMADIPCDERLTQWIGMMRDLSGRSAKKYKSLEEAIARMHGENSRLSTEQALALTIHGVNQNEDGTYSWKFDNYVRTVTIDAMDLNDVTSLWQRISCPTLLINGEESFVSNPATNGTLAYFKNARSELVAGAGHWVHHDKLNEFLALVRPFLKN